eukprot:scaffold17607_cov110-Isochrysis_galbana.AAC.4
MTWSATPCLPSDDESGPENPDPESFAGVDAGADDTEEEEPQIDALAVAAVAVTGGSVAAMPALPTAHSCGRRRRAGCDAARTVALLT